VVKKNSNIKNTLVIIVFIIFLFTAYIIANTGGTIFEATRILDGKEYYTENTIISNSAKLSQSLIIGSLNYSVLMQSSLNVLDEDELTILRVVITNPSNYYSEIKRVSVYKNNKLLSDKGVTIPLQSSQNTIYKTGEIPLIGDLARKNTIILLFRIIDAKGIEYQKEFIYNYYYLIECRSNKDCDKGFVCDLANNARFSNDGENHYCAKICFSNNDCYENQLCRKGYCGY